ncbi:MAG: GNAT family N-acetyltransferase [Burkholderiales bacterium]
MNIRPLADPTEAAECARLMAGSEPWITLGHPQQALLAVLTNPAKEVLVAKDDAGLAGLIVLDMRGAFAGYIQIVFVVPGRRGQGVGTKLMQWAEARIGRDSPNVFICVSSINDAGRGLYQRLGYQRIGTLTDFLVDGHHELLLRKTTGSWNAFRSRHSALNAAPGASG